MVEQNESITRLYRIGHTEIEITAPLSMKSPRNLEKFRTGQAKRPDDEVIHYQVEMTENLDEIKEDLLGKKTGREDPDRDPAGNGSIFDRRPSGADRESKDHAA